MSLLISTQSYQNDEPTLYGLLIEMDDTNGNITRTLRIDTPVETSRSEERLKPGLRGLCQYQDKIFVASWNAIFIVDKVSFKVIDSLSHSWMSDVHGIYVNDDGIWVTSSLPDALLLYDFSGAPIASLWMSETFVYQPNKPVDKSVDWRYRGKDFRGFREYHANNVDVKGNQVYLTGRGENSHGRVIRFNKDRFIENKGVSDQELELVVQGLYGPHDGFWRNDLFWVTETMNSSIAGINEKGKVVIRKKVFGKDDQYERYSGIRGVLKVLKKRLKGKGGKMVTHWTRGLCMNDQHIFVGQSTWAGSTTSKGRVVKMSKDTESVLDTFYIDIPNYPEPRIYQVIEI
ncbi:MAG: hypothetical protein DHS20C17_31380 [Cyclobacteriaceae bacterium]|nr:MAG: hypothetical protein DHS20C17_31380 [Cyclobacteriaceae bacterium]